MEAIIIIIGCIAAFILVQAIKSRGCLMRAELYREYEDDFAETKQTIKVCTPGDAERVLDAFVERWHNIVDDMDLACRIRTLRYWAENSERMRVNLSNFSTN